MSSLSRGRCRCHERCRCFLADTRPRPRSSASASAARSSRRSPPTAASIVGRLVAHARPLPRRRLHVGHAVRHHRRGRVARLRRARGGCSTRWSPPGSTCRAQVLARRRGVRRSRTPAAQADQLTDAGGRGMLLAPPFYFKGPGDDGLYRWFSTRARAPRAPREVILYHIPSVTGVPLSSTLIGRLDARLSRRGRRRQGLERRLGDDASATRRPPASAHPRRRRAAARARRAPRRQRRDQRLLELLRAPAAADGRATAPTCPASPRWSTSCCSYPGDAGGQGAGRASLRRRRPTPARRHRCVPTERRRARGSPRRSTRCRSAGAAPEARMPRADDGDHAARPGLPALHARAARRARSAPASSCRSASCARSPACRWARSAS